MIMRGDYFFLSNFYPCKIIFEGIEYDNSEAMFQSFKCKHLKDLEKFVGLEGKDAKTIGKRIELVDNWEEIKFDKMVVSVFQKFLQNPELLQKLLDINGLIVEDNNHRDTEWGVCNGVGENKLGRILTSVRDYFRKNELIRVNALKGMFKN